MENEIFTLKLHTSPEGIVELDRGTAITLYDSLQNEFLVDTRPSRYDPETGLNIEAQSITHESLDCWGNRQRTRISEHGAMITSHEILTQERTIQLIYGPHPAGNPNKPGDDIRGGFLLGVPNNCGDPRYAEIHGNQINFHGAQARSRTKLVHFDAENGVYVFALSDNMIPDEVPHEKGVLYLVSYKFDSEGGYTITMQTHNFGTEIVRLSEVVHPYFNTEDMKPNAIIIGEKVTGVYEFVAQAANEELELPEVEKQMKKGIFIPMFNHSIRGELPLLGLITNRYQVIMKGLKGFNLFESHIGLWTEDFLKFFCLEMFRRNVGSHDYQAVRPGKSSTLAVHIEASAL